MSESFSGNGKSAKDGRDLLSPVSAHLSDHIAVRAEGAYIWDDHDHRFLDFTSGIGVNSTGHCHPRVVAAIVEQAPKLLFAQINCMVASTAPALAAALARITPPELDCFFFANSGAEAIESAVKLAKQATGRPNVIAFQGSFHGRTHLGMALSASKALYRTGYQPLPSGVFFAPYPYAYHYSMSEAEVTRHCVGEIEALLQQQTSPEDTAMIIIEPVLGEGGYVPAPQEFLRQLRRLCDEHGILLAYDEVQCGFGRTGDWWGHSRSGAAPDLLIMAKGMGSGMPISALAASRALMDAWPVGSHGSTFGGGGAVAAAAAIATIEAIEAEDLLQNAVLMGEYLLNGLQSVQSHHAVIGDVRGVGLMIGTEFTIDGEPAGAVATAVSRACLERRLMLLNCGPDRSVIRWIPPLIVTSDQIDAALDIFTEALQTV